MHQIGKRDAVAGAGRPNDGRQSDGHRGIAVTESGYPFRCRHRLRCPCGHSVGSGPGGIGGGGIACLQLKAVHQALHIHPVDAAGAVLHGHDDHVTA